MMPDSSGLDRLLGQLRAQRSPTRPTVDELRAGSQLLTGMTELGPDVHWEAAEVAGVRAEWVYTFGTASDRALLHLHGGGFVTGSAASHRELASRLARATGCPVLVPEYRLAPEHPFPAALEDAFAAYRSLRDRGLDPARIAVSGDSSGAGLALATVLALRQGGERSPAAIVCLSPWVDLALTAPSLEERAILDPILDRALLELFAEAYLAGMDPRMPLASPLYADLRGLPPLLVQVGTADVLYDDAVRLGERARESGIDVTLDVSERMVHAWHLFAAVLADARRAIARIGDFVRSRLP